MSRFEFSVTGDLRAIANSAWISTINKGRADSRTEDDVLKVTDFLAENAHTSPFESVTITTYFPTNSESEGRIWFDESDSKYCKYAVFSSNGEMTTDLLNFYKIVKTVIGGERIWNDFVLEYPEVAGKMKKIPLNSDASLNKDEDAADCSGMFSGTNIDVQLVSVHESRSKVDDHTRITWRVKAPLSIAVQMLRHRTGSFNMVSGRYKTIRQEFTTVPNDIDIIFERTDMEILRDAMLHTAELNKSLYLKSMKQIKKLSNNDRISNAEYKRLREFIRFILPEGRMTELYVTFYKKDFKHFLKLRNSDHTQLEHVYIAQLMKKVLDEHYI